MTVDDAAGEGRRGRHLLGHLPRARPPAAVTVRAVDRAGNSRGVRTEHPDRAAHAAGAHPRRPHDRHLVGHALPARAGAGDAAQRASINTIELDLKDESGIVGYDSKVPLRQPDRRREARATRSREAVKQIHDLGGRVIGRIVAFRDPVLARYAWDHGHREQVIQAPGRRRRT